MTISSTSFHLQHFLQQMVVAACRCRNCILSSLIATAVQRQCVAAEVPSIPGVLKLRVEVIQVEQQLLLVGLHLKII